jgi:hypothetical protein
MSHVCGIEHRGSIATAHRRAGLLLGVLACAVVLVLGAPVGALAGTGSPKPAPEPLWRSYPLDPAHTRHVPPRRAVARTTKREARSNDSSVLSPVVWIVIGLAALLALLAAGYTVLRRAPGLAEKLHPALAGAVSGARRAWSMARAWTARTAAAARVSLAGLIDHFRRVGATLVTDVRGGTAPAVFAAGAESPFTRIQSKPHSPTPPKEAVMEPEKTPFRPKPVQTLKRKLHSSEEADQTDVLKQKLATPPRKRRKPPPAPLPITTARSYTADRECLIGWWRGYVRSEFYAMERTPDGEETILSRSPMFRWAKQSPPPATLKHVANAHAALVADLEASGWIVSGRSGEWYALELKRRPALPSTARKGST